MGPQGRFQDQSIVTGLSIPSFHEPAKKIVAANVRSIVVRNVWPKPLSSGHRNCIFGARQIVDFMRFLKSSCGTEGRASLRVARAGSIG